MKTLKAPWQFIAVCLAALTLLLGLFTYLNGRRAKRLQIQILSNSSLVSVTKDISSEVHILYKDRPVQTLSLILLRFENIGNEPIRESDYSEPLRIQLSPQAEVGEVDVQETRPEGIRLSPTISSNRNQVELAKTLLNPGDQAVVRMLAFNNDGTLKVSARIAGIPSLTILSTLVASTQATNAQYWILGIGLGIIFGLIGWYLTWNSSRVIAWRRDRFGFKPGPHFYRIAQEAMLSKDKTIGIGVAMSNLDKACKWDRRYAAIVLDDPLFSRLRQYDRFSAIIAKYTS